jgi:hypothetical protein
MKKGLRGKVEAEGIPLHNFLRQQRKALVQG